MPSRIKTNADEVILELNDFTSDEIIKLVQETTNNLVTSTPRKTGWAANSWVPQVGTPYSQLPGDPNINPSAGATVRASNLSRIVSTYKIGDGDVFVSSSIPYMNRLNSGHSKQAPAGFIQLAVINANATVR